MALLSLKPRPFQSEGHATALCWYLRIQNVFRSSIELRADILHLHLVLDLFTLLLTGYTLLLTTYHHVCLDR